MKLFVRTLIALFLLSLAACSTTPAKTEIVTEVVKARPPPLLLEPCKKPGLRPLLINRDLIESRQDWEKMFALCASKVVRLRQWYDKAAPQPEVGKVGPLPD